MSPARPQSLPQDQLAGGLFNFSTAVEMASLARWTPTDRHIFCASERLHTLSNVDLIVLPPPFVN